MLEKFKGIILKLADFKDADKLATIFSLEQGILTAKFTGVKKEKAKFKAAAQPFVFAEFVVAQKGQSASITQVEILDSFNGILQNYNKTICGYVVLDILRSVLPINKEEKDIFLLTISALKNIETQNEYLATIDYILKFLKFSGVQLEFSNSPTAFLDATSGNFVDKKLENSLLIDKKVHLLLKQIDEQGLNLISENETVTLNSNTQKQALRLLHNIMYLKLGEDIKSFQFI